MSEDMYRKQIERASRDKAKLEQKQADELAKAVKAEDDAAKIERSITRTTSASMLGQKQRQITSKLKKAADHRGRASKHAADAAKKQATINNAQRNLDRVVGQRERKGEAAERKRRADEKRHLQDVRREQRRAEQDAARERRLELAHERTLTHEVSSRARLHAATIEQAQLRALPEAITILLTSSDPQDEQRLALGDEVRDIQNRIRAAKHRDAVRLEAAPALRPKDLIPRLNQHEPRVVHFAGHGSTADELIFQDEQGEAIEVAPDALAATIATVSEHVALVVLNACHTGDLALAMTDHIPAAIGMKDSIGDEAARVFATSLYGAIADGYSVDRAFEQARADLMLQGIREENTPELFTADGVDPDELVLVRPPDAESGHLAA